MASSICGAARELVRIVIHAVDAAISGDDVVTYDRAIAGLASEPAGGRVLGDVLRSLLEDTHPDGFSSDDITLVVGRCYRAAVAWLPPDRVDVDNGRREERKRYPVAAALPGDRRAHALAEQDPVAPRARARHRVRVVATGEAVGR